MGNGEWEDEMRWLSSSHSPFPITFLAVELIAGERDLDTHLTREGVVADFRRNDCVNIGLACERGIQSGFDNVSAGHTRQSSVEGGGQFGVADLHRHRVGVAPACAEDADNVPVAFRADRARRIGESDRGVGVNPAAFVNGSPRAVAGCREDSGRGGLNLDPASRDRAVVG